MLYSARALVLELTTNLSVRWRFKLPFQYILIFTSVNVRIECVCRINWEAQNDSTKCLGRGDLSLPSLSVVTLYCNFRTCPSLWVQHQSSVSWVFHQSSSMYFPLRCSIPAFLCPSACLTFKPCLSFWSFACLLMPCPFGFECPFWSPAVANFSFAFI